MSLTVLQVGYALAPVGRDAAGGAEQVLTELDAALVAAGHQSVVIAPEGSRCRGTLIPLPPVPNDIDAGTQARAAERCRSRMAAVLAAHPVDVVHLHGVDCSYYLPPDDVPTLISLHLPIDWYPPDLFARAHSAWLACVSNAQRRTLPRSGRRIVTITNGVEVETLPRHDVRRRRFALMLGRVCPEKGFHVGIEAARQAEIPLVLAGRVFPYASHRGYFETAVKPHIDGRAVRWVGPIGLTKKRRLLSQAECVIVPSTAPETSSLVVMEALACGTPAIVSPAGALPELIDDGRTGFVASTVAEMAAAIRNVPQLSAQACIEAARSRFDVRRMRDRYLALYSRIARLARPPATHREGPDQSRGNPGLRRTEAACHK